MASLLWVPYEFVHSIHHTFYLRITRFLVGSQYVPPYVRWAFPLCFSYSVALSLFFPSFFLYPRCNTCPNSVKPAGVVRCRQHPTLAGTKPVAIPNAAGPFFPTSLYRVFSDIPFDRFHCEFPNAFSYAFPYVLWSHRAFLQIFPVRNTPQVLGRHNILGIVFI